MGNSRATDLNGNQRNFLNQDTLTASQDKQILGELEAVTLQGLHSVDSTMHPTMLC